MSIKEISLALYASAAIRAIDAAAIASPGASGLHLMQRAGQAAWRFALEQWPATREVVVVAGCGNNAGDGYVLAQAAASAGCRVRIAQVGDRKKLSKDATVCLNAVLDCGVEIIDGELDFSDCDLIVDALLGIGVSKPLTGTFAASVRAINEADVPVLSLDVPSGIDADCGAVVGVAVQASATVTFIAEKIGLRTGAAPAHCGLLRVEDLGVLPACFSGVDVAARLLDSSSLHDWPPQRQRTGHKGDYGHVLLIGGSPGFSGALSLCGEAAARAGAGLVSLACHPETAVRVGLQRPELMVHAIDSVPALRDLMTRADVIAVGPGLGQSAWARRLLTVVHESRKPKVIDADALNLLASEPFSAENWVLTPHPGEAARLLATDSQNVNADRVHAVRTLQQRYGGAVVLKGAGSLVADDGTLTVIGAGNPGMGSGGMGDVLTGVIAALLGQGFSLCDAARFGACVHAVAGDRAAVAGERGTLAQDLMAEIRHLVN